jgi:TPR repeat protein
MEVINIESNLELGSSFYFGTHGTTDYERAIQFLTKASLQSIDLRSQSYANLILGQAYMEGHGVDKNIETAKSYLVFAAIHDGFPDARIQAIYRISVIYLVAYNSPNYQSAFGYLQLNAEQSTFPEIQAFSNAQLGRMYIESLGVDRDLHLGFIYLNRAIENSERMAIAAKAQATYLYGQSFLRENSDDLAVLERDLLSLSIQLENPEAQVIAKVTLGLLYAYTIPRKECVKYLLLSHIQNSDLHSQYLASAVLGTLYYKGDFVEKNSETAMAYLLPLCHQSINQLARKIAYYYLGLIHAEKAYSDSSCIDVEMADIADIAFSRASSISIFSQRIPLLR